MTTPLSPSSPAPASGERPAVVALAGTTVGSYRLERRLGAGGMGEVWLGRHVISGGLGAVKLLGPRVARRADAGELFSREQRALLRLAHANIVPVFEVGQRHIAMAYIDGASLARRLRAGIAPGDVFRIGRQVASALAHAHARGVLHLDVKPSNVLVDTSGNAFLADFGAAQLVDDAGTDDLVFGTPSYLAPERASGYAPSPAADQYALGRTILAALLGVERLPAWGHEEGALPASLPPGARAALLRAVAVDPTARFPTLAAFEEALASCDVEGLEVKRAPLDVVRDEAPFRWAAHGRWGPELAPDIARADYALDRLEREAALAPEALSEFRRVSGLRTTGFSLYGHAAALGDQAGPAWLARARQLVVLVPGYLAERGGWDELAVAVVRDNPDTVVATLDHSGFGDARFVEPAVPADKVTYAAITRTMLAWTDLLGLEPLPTVFLGHSMSGTGLLLVPDEAFGPHRARISLTPMLSRVFAEAPPIPLATRVFFAVLGVLFWVPGFCRAFFFVRSLLNPAVRDLSASIRRSRLDQAGQLSPRAHVRIATSLAAAIPERREPLRRTYIAIGATDAEASPVHRARATRILGFRPERFRTLASGGHFPHFESVSSPEGTLRNRHELVQLVDEALDEVSPSRRTSTEMAETVAQDEPAVSSRSAPMTG